MRKNMLLGAAVIAAAALPGVASAHTGHIGINYNNGNLNTPGPNVDYDGWSLDGAGAFDLSGDMGAQVGVTYTDQSFNGSGSDFKNWGLDGHIYRRGEHHQIGLGLAYNSWDPGSGSNVNIWTLQAESKWFVSPGAVLGADLAYNNIDSSGSSSHSWRLDANGAFFFTDNFALNAGIGYEQINGSGSPEITDGQLGLEWQLSSVPVSLGAGWSHSNFRSSGSTFTTDALTLGARFNFGGGTLRDRAHTGANLDHITGTFERMFGTH